MIKKYYYCPNCGKIQKASVGNECKKCRWLSTEYAVNNRVSAFIYLATACGIIMILIGFILLNIYTTAETHHGTHISRSTGPGYTLEGFFVVSIGLVMVFSSLLSVNKAYVRSMNDIKKMGVQSYGQPQNRGSNKSNAGFVTTGAAISAFGVVFLVLPIPYGFVIALVCIISGMSVTLYGVSMSQSGQTMAASSHMQPMPFPQQHGSSQSYQPSTAPPADDSSIKERLSNLLELKNSGLITEDEFQRKKEEILRGL